MAMTMRSRCSIAVICRGLTGFFLRRVGDAELAFDLTAETFAAVAASCGRFRGDQAPGAVWLFGIGAYKPRESLRRGRVEADARRRLGLEAIVLEDSDLLRVEELASADGGAVEALWINCPPSSATRWWRGWWRSAPTARSPRA